MKIDKSSLEKVAHLARVEIPEGKEKELLQDLQKIISWVEKLDELDTKDVEPLTSMSFEKNVLRHDEASNTITREEGLKNSPETDQEFFKVPKVLKK